MAKLTFTAKDTVRFHDDYAMAWMPNNHPTFDPGTGYVLAHDVLEHRPTDEDKIEVELMAIGAGVYVKEADKDRRWVRYMGSDSYGFSEGKPIPEPPVSDPLPTATHKIMDQGMQTWGFYGVNYRPADKSRALGWWAAGYNAAKQRYKGIPQTALMAAHDFIRHTGDYMRGQAERGEQLMVEAKKVLIAGERKLRIEMIHMDNAGAVKQHEIKAF